jgi:hypothetical protein
MTLYDWTQVQIASKIAHRKPIFFFDKKKTHIVMVPYTIKEGKVEAIKLFLGIGYSFFVCCVRGMLDVV